MSRREILSFLRQGIDSVSVSEGYSRVFLWMDFASNFFFYRFTPKQYIGLGVYKMKCKTKKMYINFPRAHKIEKYFNDIEGSSIFNNKADFNRKFSEFVKRKWIDVSRCSETEIRDFFIKHKKVIAKPINSSGGKGIFIVDEVEKAIKLRYSAYLLEEIVENIEPIKSFSKKSLNTVRVFTLVDNNGEVMVLSSGLRIGWGLSVTDNLHTGGHVVPIDYQTGLLSGCGRDYLGHNYEYNPNRGVRYFGIKIPFWNEVKESISKVSAIISTCRYCAWDIAITSEGIEYIEGNVQPDPNLMQICGGPLYHHFVRIMENEISQENAKM